MNRNKNSSAPRVNGRLIYEKWTAFTDRLFKGMTVKERLLLMLKLAITASVTVALADIYLPIFKSEDHNRLLGTITADAFMLASGKYAPISYIALMLRAFRRGAPGLTHSLLISISFALKLAFRVFTASNQSIIPSTVNPAVTGATAYSVLSCIAFAVKEGLRAETLAPTLTILLLPPLLSAAFAGYFIPETASRPNNNEDIYRQLSACLLFAAIVIATRERYFVGCSLSLMIALFLTAATSLRNGMIKGGLLGLILGAACSPGNALPMCSVGVAAGVFSALGVGSYSTGLGMGVGCVVAIYALGYSAFHDWIPEAVIATAITSPIIRYNALPPNFPFPQKNRYSYTKTPNEETEGYKSEKQRLRLYGISDAFSALLKEQSGVDTRSSEKGEAERISAVTEQVCQQLCHGFCDTCPTVCICWNGEKGASHREVEQTVTRLATQGDAGVGAESNRLPNAGFKCIKYPELRTEIRRLIHLSGISEEYKGDRTSPALSEDYGYISQIIRDIADTAEAETREDPTVTERVKRAAKAMYIPADSISVYGDRAKTVVAYGTAEENIRTDAETLRAELSKACGTRLGKPIFSVGERAKMTLEALPSYRVETACAQTNKHGESCNGDTVSEFSTDSGYHYSMLCDGMGSGTEASEAAGLTASFTEKLLRCGLSPELAARLSGSVLRKRSTECFSTLDLLITDLISGKGTLIKSGAASSYLIRSGEVKRISAGSLPLGITAEATPKRIPLNLRSGDTVVLVSDGITGDEEDREWLTALLTECSEMDAKELADAVIKAASARYSENGIGPRDDMSVSVTGIFAIDTASASENAS